MIFKNSPSHTVSFKQQYIFILFACIFDKKCFFSSKLISSLTHLIAIFRGCLKYSDSFPPPPPSFSEFYKLFHGGIFRSRNIIPMSSQVCYIRTIKNSMKYLRGLSSRWLSMLKKTFYLHYYQL